MSLFQLTTFGSMLPFYRREVPVLVDPVTFARLEARAAVVQAGGEATAVLSLEGETVARETVREYETDLLAEEDFG